MKGNKVTFKYCKTFRPASAGFLYCFVLVPLFAQPKVLVWCIWTTLVIWYFTTVKHRRVTAAYMQDIWTVSGVMVADDLWPSLTTSTLAVGTPGLRSIGLPKGGVHSPAPTCRERSPPALLHKPHRATCVTWLRHLARLPFGAWQGQSSPEPRVHLPRKGWTCYSFCLAVCHFKKPLAQGQSSLRQTRFSL